MHTLQARNNFFISRFGPMTRTLEQKPVALECVVLFCFRFSKWQLQLMALLVRMWKNTKEREQKDMRCFGSSSDHPCVCVSVFACVWVCVFCPNCPTDGIIASGTISLHRRSSGKKDNTNIKDGKKYWFGNKKGGGLKKKFRENPYWFLVYPYWIVSLNKK